MLLCEIVDLNESDDTRDRARSLMAAATHFARSVGVRIRFKYPAYIAPEIEITDLYAKDPGSGGGTKLMTFLCGKADEEGFNLYVHPEQPRNKEFYGRFGFQRSPNHFGMLIRYCVDLDELDEGFDWSRGGGSKTAKFGDTTIIYGVSSDGASAEIISVRTPAAKRKAGAARRALEAFIREADQQGLALTLGASPLDRKTHLGKLVKFYQSLGFELTGRTINTAGEPAMARAPVLTEDDSSADVVAFADELKQRYGLWRFNASLSNGAIRLSMLAIKRSDREQGTGTKVMQELCRFADEHHLRIVLTPNSSDNAFGTTSYARLVKFYKRFGFLENKGRQKDAERKNHPDSSRQDEQKSN